MGREKIPREFKKYFELMVKKIKYINLYRQQGKQYLEENLYCKCLDGKKEVLNQLAKPLSGETRKWKNTKLRASKKINNIEQKSMIFFLKKIQQLPWWCRG